MSSERALKWAAQRAGWKLANRGENHFTADRRLYKLQMSDLRKEWLKDDLLKRRARYVEKRDKAIRIEANRQTQLAERDNDPQRIASVARKQARKEEFEERASRQAAHEARARQSAERAVARKREAETEYRRKWMEGLLKDYDVQGDAPLSTHLFDRKRAWLTPGNFDKRLQMLLIRNESPVDQWTSIARRLQADEEREAISERLGGRFLPASAPGGALAADGAPPGLAAPTGAAASLGLTLGRGGGGAAVGAGAAAAASPAGVLATSSSGPASSTASSAVSSTSEQDKMYLEGLRRSLADLNAKRDAADEPAATSTTPPDGSDDGEAK